MIVFVGIRKTDRTTDVRMVRDSAILHLPPAPWLQLREGQGFQWGKGRGETRHLAGAILHHSIGNEPIEMVLLSEFDEYLRSTLDCDGWIMHSTTVLKWCLGHLLEMVALAVEKQGGESNG